jgi:hypothetical protein
MDTFRYQRLIEQVHLSGVLLIQLFDECDVFLHRLFFGFPFLAFPGVVLGNRFEIETTGPFTGYIALCGLLEEAVQFE